MYRLDAAGRGTWDAVTRSLALLDAYGVETNLLCVVTGQLARKPQRAFKSLCELGQHNLQFIPCLDPLDTIGGQAYSLTPELYGRFLCGILMFGISSCSRDIISASVISKIICASCWECRRPPVHPPAPVDTILQ